MNTTLDMDWWMKDTFDRIPAAQRTAWDVAVKGLEWPASDDFGSKVPCGTGHHNYIGFEMWLKWLPKASKILEIGFNIGFGSAAMLAINPDLKIVSMDIRDSREVRQASSILNSRYSGRHTLIIGDSANAANIGHSGFDGAFIDGAHNLDSILKDIAACRALGIRQFLMDDVLPQLGDTLQAIRLSALKLHAVVAGNMAICEDQ